ncbi:SsrA-binding protein SmpB [bacterium]|jgi:SsrA-binding protein|nr:SsrA-binding protein SmpB [bacterium]
MKIITVNKRGLHEYEILEKFEAGIVLSGDEIKSIRQNGVSLTDSFATVTRGEVSLLNCHIAPYSHAFTKSYEPKRTRKLLLHRREIEKLAGNVSAKGLTLVPIKLYFGSRGYVKVELGLARHKKLVNKKKELKEKDLKREASRESKYSIK